MSDPARSFVVPGVGYGAVSPYKPLPSGSYVISMRGAGAAPDSPAVISTSVDARPGGAYTVAGVGMSAELGLAVLSDKLETPAAGKASVRVINGAASAPAVDVGPANGPTWAGPVKFGTDTPYVDVPLGTWNLKVTSPGGGPELTTPCQLDANSTYTVLLVDRGGALKAELLTDSAGSAVVPSGGVNAGYGGMADRVGVDPAAAGRRADHGRGRRAGAWRSGNAARGLRPWSIASPAPHPAGAGSGRVGAADRRRTGAPARPTWARPLAFGALALLTVLHLVAALTFLFVLTTVPPDLDLQTGPRSSAPAPQPAGSLPAPGRPTRRAPRRRPGARAVAAGHRAGHPGAGHPPVPAGAGRRPDRGAAATGPARRGRLVHRGRRARASPARR